MLSVTPAGVFDMSVEEVRSRVDRACAIITRLRFILEGVMDRLGQAQVRVSDRGLRWGLLAHRFGRPS